MRSSDFVAAWFAIVVLVGAPASALATPNFPPVVARELQLGGPPDCSLCHAGGVTRRGTVTTPFGTSMRARGLVAYEEASLVTALQALTGERRDSDQDGTPDIDELKAGTDPNARAGDDVGPPEYGCGRIAPRPAARFEWAVVALATLVFVRRLTARRARRARP